MLRGFKIINGLKSGTLKYLEEMGYNSPQDIPGDIYKKITSFSHLLQESKSSKVKINEETCTGCKLCVVACDDAAYDALSMKDIPDATRSQGKRAVAELHYDKCTGCNLCVAVCPVPECITLYDSGKAFPYALDKSYAENTLEK